MRRCRSLHGLVVISRCDLDEGHRGAHFNVNKEHGAYRYWKRREQKYARALVGGAHAISGAGRLEGSGPWISRKTSVALRAGERRSHRR